MKTPNKDPNKDPKEDGESLQDFLREVQTVARKAFESAFKNREPSLLAQFVKAFEEAQTPPPFQSMDAKESARDKMDFFKLFILLDLGLQTEEEAQTLRRFVQFVRKSFLCFFVRLVSFELMLEDVKGLLREDLRDLQPFANQFESLGVLSSLESLFDVLGKVQKLDKGTKKLLQEMATAGRLIETPKKWQTCAGLSEEESKNILDAWQAILPEMKRRAGL